MAERLTVVFDNPELYRELKVFAAERGVPMKQIIEEALTAHLRAPAREEGSDESRGARVLDWDQWDSFQAQLDAIAEEPGLDDASDIKHQLYGAAPRELTERGWRYAAEEPAQYDAGNAGIR